MRLPPSKARAAVQFSPEDADLFDVRWRLNRTGYAYRTDGRNTFIAHRIIAARMYGRALGPTELVDHINFNKVDNRRENLRLVTHVESAQHRRPYGESGFRGVVLHKKSGKWQAAVGHRNRKYYCGLHDTPEQAAAAAAAKRAELGFLGGNG